MTTSRKIKIAFVDYPNQNTNARIIPYLRERFDLEEDYENPDYILYSVFHFKHLQYPNAVRIFFTGENVHPDFNLCDYALGYDYLDFGDRYLRCSNYVFYKEYPEIIERKRSTITHEDLARDKTKFCNFVYSNPAVHPFRDEVFKALDKHKRVDSLGEHLNNIEVPIGSAFEKGGADAKVDFQRAYKFSFAFENSTTPGYTTEKIVQAMAADTIPIYWGNLEVFRDFNPKRFINCHDFNSAEEIVARVLEIDQNDEEYLKIMSEPFFLEGQVPEVPMLEQVLQKFEYIFNQPKEIAYRRSFYAWGAQYECIRKEHVMAFEWKRERRWLTLMDRVKAKFLSLFKK